MLAQPSKVGDPVGAARVCTHTPQLCGQADSQVYQPRLAPERNGRLCRRLALTIDASTTVVDDRGSRWQMLAIGSQSTSVDIGRARKRRRPEARPTAARLPGAGDKMVTDPKQRVWKVSAVRNADGSAALLRACACELTDAPGLTPGSQAPALLAQHCLKMLNGM